MIVLVAFHGLAAIIDALQQQREFLFGAISDVLRPQGVKIQRGFDHLGAGTACCTLFVGRTMKKPLENRACEGVPVYVISSAFIYGFLIYPEVRVSTVVQVFTPCSFRWRCICRLFISTLARPTASGRNSSKKACPRKRSK